MEAIYVFRRLYFDLNSTQNAYTPFNSSHTGGFHWSIGERFRSSDYDFDLINSVPRMHTANFGKAVVATDRTLAVGAPFADYDNSGHLFLKSLTFFVLMFLWLVCIKDSLKFFVVIFWCNFSN